MPTKHTLEIRCVDPVCQNESNASDTLCFIQSATYSKYTAGTSQGLKLTLNLETDEYMAGPASGSGAFVSNLYLTHYKINRQI